MAVEPSMLFHLGQTAKNVLGMGGMATLNYKKNEDGRFIRRLDPSLAMASALVGCVVYDTFTLIGCDALSPLISPDNFGHIRMVTSGVAAGTFGQWRDESFDVNAFFAQQVIPFAKNNFQNW